MQTQAQPAISSQSVRSTAEPLTGEQHPIPLTILLHLLPGAIVTLLYALLVPQLLKAGINNLITLNLLAMVVLVPIELGMLYRAGWWKNGRLSLEGIVLNREKLPIWQLVGLAFVLLVISGLAFKLLAPIFDPLIQKTLFGWLPAWFPLETNFAAMPKGELVVTLVISLFCTSWIAPVVEELYFRGYLLPRLSRYRQWAPVMNAVLFTLYHFFTPWAFVERVITVIPLAWLAQKKRNIYIGILVHLTLNTIGILPALIATILKPN